MTRVSFTQVKQRYNAYRREARACMEGDIFRELHWRIDVVEVDDDVLRKAEVQWPNQERRVHWWDWQQIVDSDKRCSVRYFNFALLRNGQLCALASCRVSHKKRWLSLTHLEGAPGNHPLKGMVVPLVVNALYIYRAVICQEGTVEKVGIRLLNPLTEALECYAKHGYTPVNVAKKTTAIVIEEPIGFSAGE